MYCPRGTSCIRIDYCVLIRIVIVLYCICIVYYVLLYPPWDAWCTDNCNCTHVRIEIILGARIVVVYCTHWRYLLVGTGPGNVLILDMVPHGCTHLRVEIYHLLGAWCTENSTRLRYLVYGYIYANVYSHLRYLLRGCTHYGSEYTWGIGWSKVSA